MAIFIGNKIQSGQVSVCGDAYRRRVTRLKQHLALLIVGGDITFIGRGFVKMTASERVYEDFIDKGMIPFTMNQ
jgi:hypothetical protein